MIKNMKKISDKVIDEIKRYNQINKYIFEQEAPLPPEGQEPSLPLAPGMDPSLLPDPNMPAPPATDTALQGATPPPAPEVGSTPVDVTADPDVEKIGDEVKEVDVTDLVKSQKTAEEKQGEFFNKLFDQLNSLEAKIGDMDNIFRKLDSLESKIEKYRVKTPEEKLELRTLDSGPFSQKLSDFFDDKQPEMEKSGKNEYILTKDEVEDYSDDEIKKSFRSFEKEGDNFLKIR